MRWRTIICIGVIVFIVFNFVLVIMAATTVSKAEQRERREGHGQSNVIGSKETVRAVVGHDAILPCHLEPPFNVTILIVVWKRDGIVVHVHRNGRVAQHKNFRNRTSLFHDKMVKGNFSLKLTNVTKLDEGNYSCHVPTLQSKVSLIIGLVQKSNKEKQTYDKPETEKHQGLNVNIIIAVAVIAAVIAAVFAAGYVIWKKCGNNTNNGAEPTVAYDAGSDAADPADGGGEQGADHKRHSAAHTEGSQPPQESAEPLLPVQPAVDVDTQVHVQDKTKES